MRLLDESELPGEEVLEIDRLVVFEVLIRARLEWEADIHTV